MLLGVIGDDFTGSSDIANNLKKAGMSVGMYSGVPDNKIKLNIYLYTTHYLFSLILSNLFLYNL